MSVCGAFKEHLVIGHIVSGFILLCSAVISCPLYFGYFVFFLPYVVKLVSLLCPLFVTCLLGLIAFVTGVAGENCAGDRLPEGGIGYLLIAYACVVDRLRLVGNCDRNEEFLCVEDFGMFEVFFGSCEMSEVEENGVEVVDENPAEAPLPLASKQGDLGIGESEGCEGTKDEIGPIRRPQLENGGAGSDERRLENFLKILDQFERMTSNVEVKKKVEPWKGTKANKVVENITSGSHMRNGSKATAGKVNVASSSAAAQVSVGNPYEEKQDTSVDHKCEDGGESLPEFESFDHSYRENATKVLSSRSSSHQSFDDDRYELGSYGSMRKEKEWKRTLACKLFEERHNVGGGEGMDSLWETYEMDANNLVKSKIDKKKSKVKKEIEEEEEDDQVRHLCCLQAIKLSTGKMNMGMGRPNLVKITKAIKGLGWLHHVSNKHSKKVHNNGDNRY